MTFNWLGLLPSIVIFVGCCIAGWVLGKRIFQLRTIHKELNPPPPVNVRLHLHDGREMTVDTVLSKVRTWDVVMPAGITPMDVDGFHVDELPPYSTIGVTIPYA